jgi:NAD(P)-dependent dehydrogenase (short-subunit alcohol dehydrogenase family)
VFTELARRLYGTGVTANVLHPGVVRTAFGAEDPSTLARIPLPLARFLKSPTQRAATSVYLASSADVEGVTGQYFANRKPKRSNEFAYDTGFANRLWLISGRLVVSGRGTAESAR